MTDWMTTLEAARRLGLCTTSGGTLGCLRRAGVEETRSNGAGSGRHGRCLWRADQVEVLAKEREHAAWLKAQGFKFCVGCKDWKPLVDFAPSAHRCRPCMRLISRTEWAERKGYAKNWANSDPERRPGPLSDYMDLGPAKPGSSDKYECMMGFFQHKPQPPEGRRKAYCRKCKAPRCVHHPELSPKEVRKLVRVPSRYPAFELEDYVDA